MVAHAPINSFPVVIYKPSSKYAAVPIISDKYSRKSKKKRKICSAVLSPKFFGALLLFCDGKLKFANWSDGAENETVEEVAEGERLEEDTDQFPGSSSVAFTRDGMGALAVDRRGKVLAMRFEEA